MASRLRLYWQFTWIAVVLFVPVAWGLEFFQADPLIAHAYFFHDSRWVGADSWWITGFIHTGGRWAIRLIVVAVLVFWIVSLRSPALRIYRRPSGYFVLAAVLSIGIVGLLKTMTNVHCPWDLVEFGGSFPHIPLFAPRPSLLKAGQCFPAAHASSGYALMVLYFVFRERSKLLARLGLVLGVGVGVVFGLAQQARGAHFLSHDLWSAFLVWMILAGVYVFAFRGELWPGAAKGT